MFHRLQSWSRGAAASFHLLRPVGPYPKLYDAGVVQAVKFDERLNKPLLHKHKDCRRTFVLECHLGNTCFPTRKLMQKLDMSLSFKDQSKQKTLRSQFLLYSCLKNGDVDCIILSTLNMTRHDHLKKEIDVYLLQLYGY
ncbi:Uncharacterized protein Rs2_27610 [Raphanus sativus]|nr:Uncharacterized protein Rs2_27610 [Raphanus sativus]